MLMAVWLKCVAMEFELWLDTLRKIIIKVVVFMQLILGMAESFFQYQMMVILQ